MGASFLADLLAPWILFKIFTSSSPCRRLRGCRRERDFCGQRQAPQTCLRDVTYAQRYKSRPHRSRKTGRKWAFPRAGLPRRVSVDWMVDEPGLEPATHRLRVRNNVVVEMAPHACLMTVASR
jgi:hypothetical protein